MNIIRLIHIIILIVLIGIPFTNILQLHMCYFIIIPTIVMHWVFNSNVCALTVLESILTNTPMNDTFINSILDPFFRIEHNSTYYIITLVLYSISCYKLYLGKSLLFSQLSILKDLWLT